MNAFTSYVAHIKDSGIPVLGYLTYYNVSKSAVVDFIELGKAIDKYDAPMKAPKQPNGADVFRRGCNEAERKKVRTANSNEFVNYLLENTGYTEDVVYRTLVSQKVDSKSHELDYNQLIKLVYYRTTNSVETEPVTGSPDPDLTGDPISASIVAQVRDYVKTQTTFLSLFQVRHCITTALEKNLKGIAVSPSGGIYFIDNDHAEGLEAVEAVANAFNGVSIRMLPLIDDEKQRQQIKEAFETESLYETQKLVGELQDLLDKDSISARKYTDAKVRFDEQREKMEQYKKILDHTSMDAEITLGVAEALIQSILEKSLKDA
jgi:hypothetical protein